MSGLPSIMIFLSLMGNLAMIFTSNYITHENRCQIATLIIHSDLYIILYILDINYELVQVFCGMWLLLHTYGCFLCWRQCHMF